MQFVIILMLIVGLVLVYSAIKAKDPRDIIKDVMQRNKQNGN